EAVAVADAVEDEQAAAADGRHRVALADLLLPHDPQAVLGPLRQDALLGRDAVRGGAEGARPVAARGAGAQVFGELLVAAVRGERAAGQQQARQGGEGSHGMSLREPNGGRVGPHGTYGTDGTYGSYTTHTSHPSHETDAPPSIDERRPLRHRLVT